MPKKYTLGKTGRLKSRKAIERLFGTGTNFTVSFFRVFYLQTASGGLLFGAGASSKKIKKAVSRNRIKRLTREAFRLKKIQLQEAVNRKNTGLHLFFVYTGKEVPVYRDVADTVEIIISKLLKLINETTTPVT